jgi:DNA-binding response OmpR family regulator
MLVLIVEDDPVLADGMAAALRPLGLQPVLLHDGAQAAQVLARERFGLVILDIGLPGVGGLSLLRRLRQADSHTPVLLVTARDSAADRIGGLDLGADDYLVKPVLLPELAARVRALLRRLKLQSSEMLAHGPLRLDTRARRAWLHDAPLDLTMKEWQLIEYLLRRPETVVSKAQLHEAMAGDEEATYNTVEVYVSRLRSKLEDSGIRIRTVRGFGYMLRDWQDGAAA